MRVTRLLRRRAASAAAVAFASGAGLDRSGVEGAGPTRHHTGKSW